VRRIEKGAGAIRRLFFAAAGGLWAAPWKYFERKPPLLPSRSGSIVPDCSSPSYQPFGMIVGASPPVDNTLSPYELTVPPLRISIDFGVRMI